MPKLSARQVAEYAAKAGFRGADLQTSVAVALAESGGNTDAHALTSREDSRGLWQINVRAHPQYANANLYDPATNASAAKTILSQSGWRAWSTFTNGKFLLYMPTAGANVRSLPGGIDTGDPIADKAAGAVETVGNPLQAASQALGLATKAGTWISNPRNWTRIMYVVLGGALLIGALIVVAEPVAAPAIKTAAKIAATG